MEELEEMFLKDPRIKTAAVFEENHHPAVSIVSDLPEEDVREYLAEINRNLPRFKQIRKLYLKPDTPGGRIK